MLLCYVVVFWEVNEMNELYNLLAAVVNTGDDADPGKWIWIMVVVGVLLVILAIVSVVIGKKRNAVDETVDTKEE